jgi:N,N'-diacetyllegionaminate synthase
MVRPLAVRSRAMESAMKGNIRIGSREVGAGCATFVVAEVGINHGGSLETAKLLIEAAAKSSADAVKFQTYRTEKRVPRESPLFEILKRCELNEAAHRKLIQVARDLGIPFFSTPFDPESVGLLESLDVPAYKIASFDIVNLALVRAAASKARPLIVSRGMADASEIDRAVEAIERAGAPYMLLHCVSAYPLKAEDANLRVIVALQSRYTCPVGYSDHTIGIEVPVLAVAAGACAIEKHFTLDRNAPGPDHALSANPREFHAMVERIREIEPILGRDEIRLLEAERAIVPYRRPSA